MNSLTLRIGDVFAKSALKGEHDLNLLRKLSNRMPTLRRFSSPCVDSSKRPIIEKIKLHLLRASLRSGQSFKRRSNSWISSISCWVSEQAGSFSNRKVDTNYTKEFI